MKNHIKHAVKIVLFLVALIFLIWAVTRGTDLGIKKASEYVVIPLIEPLDSSGVPLIPDSVHIITYSDNISAKAFSATNTTYPFSAVGIDTTKDYGDTCYWFIDQIQDIDGTAGNFELAIMVTLFCDGLPTTTRATVQVINDSLNEVLGLLKAKADSSSYSATGRINSKVILINPNAITEASIVNNAITAAKIADDAIDYATFAASAPTAWWNEGKTGYELTAANMGAIADSVWDKDTVDAYNVAVGIGKFVKDSVAKEATVQIIDDSIDVYDDAGHFQADIQEALDTLQVYDDANQLRPEVAAILDTLQNQDDWIASESNVTEVLDTLKTYDEAGRFQLDIQEVLDTLQVYDNANQLRPEVATILDTLQNQDNWVGNVRYEHSDSILLLRGLHVIAESNSDDTAIIAKGGGLGIGIGLFCEGSVVDGKGIQACGTDAVQLAGTVYGLYVKNTGASGAGFRASGGTGSSVDIYAPDCSLNIHGTIDRVTYADSVDTVITEPSGGSSNWSNDQRDSVLAVIADGGNSGKIGMILDTLRNQDNWVAKEAGEIGDILDTLQNQDDWVAKEATVQIIDDSLDNQDDWVAKEATVQIIDDSIDVYDDAGHFQLDVQEILDTLQVYDNANQLRPEVAAILDTLQNQDDWVAQEAGEIADILDTLQNHDDWVAHQSTVDSTGEMVWANVDTAATIDTSEIGEWLSTGISTSISDANMGAIADSVWDKDTVDAYNVAVGIGKFVKDSTGGTISCEGSGVRSIIFKTFSDADSSAIADVRIEAQTGGSYYADCHTSVAGICTLSLDDATYTIHVNDPPNDFTSPITFVVTADSTDTLFGTVFAGSTPPSADKCNLYTSVYDITGDSLSGCILTVTIPERYWEVTVEGNPISPYNVSDTSDVHGDIGINAWESGSMVAGDTTLTVKVDLRVLQPGEGVIAEVLEYTVPDSASHKIVW